MFKKVLVIHHCDADGRLAAEMCERYEEMTPGNDSISIDFLEADYKSSLEDLINAHMIETYDVPDQDISYYDRVYLLDYSISNKDNVKYITGLAEDGFDITWIDHHISSIDIINNSDEHTSELLRNIKGLRVINTSGSMLSFLYFNNQLGDIDAFDYGCMRAISNTHTQIERFVIEKLWEKYLPNFPELPVLMYVDAWDIWDHDTNLGWDNVKYAHIVLENYTVSDFSKLIDSYQDMNDIIDIGKSVYSVNAKRNEVLCKSFGFEFPIVVTDNTGEKAYKAFALNYPLTNSELFGSRMDEYDICMPFYFNGTNYTYSMYSTKPDIDCSTLCRYYNGGGHPKAAGFVRDELIIAPKKTLYIDLYLVK